MENVEGYIFRPKNVVLVTDMDEKVNRVIESKIVESLTHFKDCWIMYNYHIHNYEICNFYTGEVMPTSFNSEGVRTYKMLLTTDSTGKEVACNEESGYYGCVPFHMLNRKVSIGEVEEWSDKK